VIIKRYYFHIGDLRVEVVRKDIKNLHVGVYPPQGRIRVAVPLRLNKETVRLALISRLGWIRRQQKHFAQQERQSKREMVAGESHFYQGRRYRLDVIEHDGPPSVRLRSSAKLELRIRPKTKPAKREIILQQWYRCMLREQIPILAAKWEAKAGIKIAEVRIKRMKTRWGTCNPNAGRIWLNLELVKKPVACLEYILVHEMVHLLERQHSERFRDRMDTLLPSWRLLREELNRAPLAHEEWRY
jgi:predicted metal-dependent hydrolase